MEVPASFSSSPSHQTVMEETDGISARPGNLSRKIVAISAGEAHTLALTGDGKVYSWGRGTFGRLGTGSEEDRHMPVQVRFFGNDIEEEEKLMIVGVAAGAYHSLALADDGSIWGWGYGTYGQLGATGENYLIPHLLEGFSGLGSGSIVSSSQDQEAKRGKPLKISFVKAGGMMSLAIDDLGSLWMWGNCPYPSLNSSTSAEGEFVLGSSSEPVPVWNFHGQTVVKVACGNEHVVALVSAGETYEGGDLLCYSWGGNKHGQLGLGDAESRWQPEMIETFNLQSSWEAYDVACGASHTAVLAQKRRPSDVLESVCWTFGLGDNGQLGHGTTRDLPSPELVKGLPESVFLVSVDCGLFHTSVVSSAGEVWSWGMEKGLGLCPDARFAGTDSGDALSPLLVPCNGLHDPRFREPLQVACGAAHTALVADSGYRLWSWGRGRSGVLGNGRTVDCYVPTLVLWPLLSEDFTEHEVSDVEQTERMNPGEGSAEVDKRLSAAMAEMKLLQSKLSVMERYASMLHGSIFGRPLQEHEIPASLQDSDRYDVAKQWENMLESSDQRKLAHLEMFYRNMLGGVKDKLMKRKIQEIVKECIRSQATSSSE